MSVQIASGQGTKTDKAEKIKTRNYALDVLRIFCCYLIIMLHVSGHLDAGGSYWRVIQGIVRPALWCFMMLSGYFILSNPIVDWAAFYLKHLTHLVIPLFFYVFVYQLYYSGGKRISILEIIAGDPYGHLWFVYSLIVLYLMAPFLQKMLNNISKKQLTGLLIGMFFCGRVITILAAFDFSIGIPVTIIGDCSLFFFLIGYWLWQNDKQVEYKILIPIGIINVIYTAYTFSDSILVDGAATLSLGMVCGVIVYFYFFSKVFQNAGGNVMVRKLIYFISARTYGIYLIHILILNIFTERGIMQLDSNSISQFWILPFKCLVIFIIGLVISTVYDLLICNPIQKYCNYIGDKIINIKQIGN